MYVHYELVDVTAVVKGIQDLHPHNEAVMAELRVETQNMKYIMDGLQSPAGGAGGVGMTMLPGDPPKLFTMDQLNKIKFVRGAGSDGVLHVHYLKG